jgi:transcriptional regulator with XRE-family HTH domain
VSGSWPRVRSTDHVALGRAVRELRLRRGVPQAAVSFDAGMDAKYVGKVERGAMNASFGALLRIVRTLGYPLSDLIAIYEREIAQTDPQAGAQVPACPTAEALAHCRQITDANLAAYYAMKARRARSRMR